MNVHAKGEIGGKGIALRQAEGGREWAGRDGEATQPEAQGDTVPVRCKAFARKRFHGVKHLKGRIAGHERVRFAFLFKHPLFAGVARHRHGPKSEPFGTRNVARETERFAESKTGRQHVHLRNAVCRHVGLGGGNDRLRRGVRIQPFERIGEARDRLRGRKGKRPKGDDGDEPHFAATIVSPENHFGPMAMPSGWWPVPR